MKQVYNKECRSCFEMFVGFKQTAYCPKCSEKKRKEAVKRGYKKRYDREDIFLSFNNIELY